MFFGLQRLHAACDNALDMMDKLRDTGNALNRETIDQYRQAEKQYENKLRYGP